MIVNNTNLQILGRAFSAAFRGGLEEAPSQYPRITMMASSSTKSTEYGWLGKLPNVREWIGDRVIHGVESHDYTIKNKTFELTVGVDRDDIDDDNVGIYTPLFTEMGRSTGALKDQLLWGLLKNGTAELCYDGQPFFDTDHPVLDADGQEVSVSNWGGGAGTAWYLLDPTRAVKPLIWQDRRPFELVRLDRVDDENVFMRKEFVYGTDGRGNAGFGFWQLAYGSQQDLTAANYSAARAAMQGMKGDYGRPLALRPSLLVVPPSLEGAALEILNAERDSGGATNVWKGTAEPMVVPWLA